jgi:hypothetical protein
MEINWVAVLVAAVSTFVLGGLWFGPLFGKAWMRVSAMTPERAAQGNTGRIFGVSFLLQLLAAAVLAAFLGPEEVMAFGPAVAASASVGIAWVAPAFGVVYLFEQRPLGHFLVNAGYHVVSFILMGLIIAAWR